MLQKTVWGGSFVYSGIWLSCVLLLDGRWPQIGCTWLFTWGSVHQADDSTTTFLPAACNEMRAENLCTGERTLPQNGTKTWWFGNILIFLEYKRCQDWDIRFLGKYDLERGLRSLLYYFLMMGWELGDPWICWFLSARSGDLKTTTTTEKKTCEECTFQWCRFPQHPWDSSCWGCRSFRTSTSMDWTE